MAKELENPPSPGVGKGFLKCTEADMKKLDYCDHEAGGDDFDGNTVTKKTSASGRVIINQQKTLTDDSSGRAEVRVCFLCTC